MFNIKGKRRRKEFNRKVSRRDEFSWLKEWKCVDFDLSKAKFFCESINKFMGYSNHYFLPNDPVADVFFNPYSDLRDIEVLVWLEDQLNISLNDYNHLDTLIEVLNRTHETNRMPAE